MRIVLVFFILISQVLNISAQRLISKKGTIDFVSDAPLEVIKASSNKLHGVIDLTEQEFAFTVYINSFTGFNSPLQKEHFNENYMESSVYPKAVYTGKFLDKVDLSNDGKYVIRSKGWLNIHGKAQERIIKSTIEVKDKVVSVNSNFVVLLQEYNISIPLVVHQKIAEEINIKVNIEFNLN